MSDEAKRYQLIVRQQPGDSPALAELLRTLQAEYGLESYTARQRLVGQGLALFGQGGLGRSRTVAGLLQGAGYACWVIEPSEPRVVPDRLRSLEIGQDRVDFSCSHGAVKLEKGASVVAVLADISGELNTRLVKRMLGQQTYRGHVPAQQTRAEDLVRSIYQGKPVFDFYVLAADRSVAGAVRASPGKFDHHGLGERGGLSAVLNLDALRRLVEEYAGDYDFYPDFGLGFLPDCRLDAVSERSRRVRPRSLRSTSHGYVAGPVEVETELRDNQAVLSDNLQGLTRYGWLVMQLQGDGRPPGGERASSDEAGGAVAATVAVAAGHPMLAAALAQSQGDAVIPGLDEVVREVAAAAGDDTEERAAAPPTAALQRDLPAPPDRPDQRSPLLRSLLPFAAIAGVVGLVAVSGGKRVLTSLVFDGFSSGALPALVAVGLCWGGLHFIRLKRLIENTPTSRIRSIAMGMVEVHGQARRLYALVAPMTQSACAWYRLRKYRKDKNDHWKLIRELDSSHVPFQVDDGSGRVTVAPAAASVRAGVRQIGYPGQSPLSFTAFGGSFGEDEKWVEDILYEGTSLYVMGYAQPLREEKVSLRARTTARLRQLKLDPRAMRRYDTDGDGRIDGVEWDAARSEVEQQALRESLAEQGARKRQEERVVICRPRQRRLPFLIAETGSEEQLRSRYGWYSIPLLLSGVAAAGFALYRFLLLVQG
jgi:hypothetical protein